MKSNAFARNHESRRAFIGGSDARIIMGPDEAALIRLWKEKRGEAEPEDLSGNLIVQLGVATEALNRAWWRAFQIDPVAFVVSGSRKRTPFPGRKSMPAASSAFFTSSRVARRNSIDALEALDGWEAHARAISQLSCRDVQSSTRCADLNAGIIDALSVVIDSFERRDRTQFTLLAAEKALSHVSISVNNGGPQ